MAIPMNALGWGAALAALASAPLNATIPGAMSVKVIGDRADANNAHFQNSRTYKIHWDFV